MPWLKSWHKSGWNLQSESSFQWLTVKCKGQIEWLLSCSEDPFNILLIAWMREWTVRLLNLPRLNLKSGYKYMGERSIKNFWQLGQVYKYRRHLTAKKQSGFTWAGVKCTHIGQDTSWQKAVWKNKQSEGSAGSQAVQGYYPEQRESLLSWAGLLAELPARHLTGPLLSSETPECRDTARFGCCSSGKADRQSSRTRKTWPESRDWEQEVLNREQSTERGRNSPDRAGLVQEQPGVRSQSAKNATETTALHKQLWFCCGRRRWTEWSAEFIQLYFSRVLCPAEADQTLSVPSLPRCTPAASHSISIISAVTSSLRLVVYAHLTILGLPVSQTPYQNAICQTSMTHSSSIKSHFNN